MLNIRGEDASTFDSTLQAVLIRTVAHALSASDKVKENLRTFNAGQVKAAQVRVLAVHSDGTDGCGDSDRTVTNDDDVSARHAELTCLVLQVRFASEQSARRAAQQLKSARFARLLSAQLSTVTRLKWHGSADFSVSSPPRNVERVQALSGARLAPVPTTTPAAQKHSTQLLHPMTCLMTLFGIGGCVAVHRARQRQDANVQNGANVELRSEVAPLRTAAALAQSQSQSRPAASRLDEEVMI